MKRRGLLKAGIAAGALPLVWNASHAAGRRTDFSACIQDLEHKFGGRLGVAALDTGSQRLLVHRGNQRFLLCSTFKVMAAGLILRRVDEGRERLDRRISYSAADLVTYSPETEKHVDHGMTLGAICKAGLTLSDNTAANMMLASFGGPGALTDYIRSLDDDVTRLDRTEVALNNYAPGDPRDTTTPLSMVTLTQQIVLGDALSPASKQQLQTWMRANTTGDHRLRAGLPETWQVADKTGSGGNNTANDVGIFWPPGRPPIVVAAYYTGSTASHPQRDGIIAAVGRVVADI